MPAKHLTDAFVRTVKLPNKHDRPNQIMYLDTTERGWALQLVVSYGGSKTFRAMRYVNGKPHSTKLGLYPQMSVKQARDLARSHFENPQKFAEQTAVGSFKDVADNWLKRHVDAHQLISGGELRRQLDKYVYPKWKDRPFIEIRRRDVIELIEKIADKNGRVQAERVLQTIGQVMKWHQSRDENYTSVIVPGMRPDKRQAKDRKRKRILSDDEIRAVWKKCEQVDAKFGALLKLALLTAQRCGKVTTMKWADLDMKKGVWTIPVENPREKGHAGALALPKSALAIINRQPVIKGNPHVFPRSPRGQWKSNPSGAPVFNSWSQRKLELDELLPSSTPHWTIHDLRRTARSLMSRAGVRPDISERVMGHAIGGVEEVYDRHSYTDEKADALIRLSGLIEQILNPAPANVVPLKPRR